MRTCPVLIMVAGDSRRLEARLLPSPAFRDVWIAHHRVLQEWGAVPHTLRWENHDIQPLTLWYFEERGWNLSWDTYMARAELADLTVQTGLPMPALHAARRSLETAFPSQPTAISPHTLRRGPQVLGGRRERHSHLACALGIGTLRHAHARRCLTAARAARPGPRHARRGDGYVAIAGNHYLVGAWGARRKLTVEVTNTEVVIGSSGYHAGGFHTVTYARSWARGVHLTDPQHHTVSESGTSRTVPGP
ncbi:hypothetical protein ACFW17_37240 [Streptomyces sp. NPDC058961]|uniref:hypothetical protein n=1 Tax=Streptomyces sp. NPDC058961 TaxID=3346680 RepID=UPI0036A32AC0